MAATTFDLGTVFLDLINAHIGIANKISRVYTNNEEDRQDLLQEMMYQLWRSFPSFDKRSKFSTWMYKVCLNTSLTYKKKKSPKNTLLIHVIHEQIPDQPQATEDEAIIALYRSISTLDPVNKALILLYLEELSYEEIANISGLSKANVSVKLVRIKRYLEKTLAQLPQD